MIEIKVRSFRGIDRADIAVGPLALVAGRNHTGKSSIVQAAAAVLTGRPVPLGLKKGDAGMLVKTGEAEASVAVKTARGTLTCEWPDATPASTGEPPQASAFAVGLESIVYLGDRERAGALAPYMPDATPSRDDLTAMLRDGDVAEATINKVWEKIAAEGWDAAHVFAKESGARLKGQWEATTGANYGSAVARKWLPAAWTEELAGASLDALEQAAGAAKVALEQAIAGAAVDAATLDRLRAESATLADMQTRQLGEQERIDALEAEIARLQGERDALPPARGDAGLSCPHCGEPVTMLSTGPGQWRIAKTEKKLPAVELKARREAIAAADGALANAKGRLTTARNRMRQLGLDIDRARRAEDQLRDAESRAGGPEGQGAGAVDRAREALRAAEARKAAFEAKTAADAKAAAIAHNAAIQAALAPDGLRKKALARGLETFDLRLADLCKAADWKPVTLGADLMPRYGGRHYVLCSASEQYRVRATLAVAMAQLDKSAMVILDGADILDAGGRNGLIGLLQAAKLPALIALTLGHSGVCPDLEKIGIGRSYWLDRAVASPLAEAVRTKDAA